MLKFLRYFLLSHEGCVGIMKSATILAINIDVC